MTQKRCLRKHCTLPAQIILIRQAPSCRGRNPNKSSCFHLCPLFFDRITADEGGERRGRGEDEGRSARPPTPERMTTSLSPPGTLQKEFAAFPWAEIILVAALSWVKKKVSGQRNAVAIGCGGSDSQEQGGTLCPHPVRNNQYLWRVQVQEGFATPMDGSRHWPGWTNGLFQYGNSYFPVKIQISWCKISSVRLNQNAIITEQLPSDI